MSHNNIACLITVKKKKKLHIQFLEDYDLDLKVIEGGEVRLVLDQYLTTVRSIKSMYQGIE